MQLFFLQVEDYESARRYVSIYLQEKDTSAVAHKLNGQILEKLKQHEKVLIYLICPLFLQ